MEYCNWNLHPLSSLNDINGNPKQIESRYHGMRIPEKEQFEELCAAYALGVLDDDERILFDDGLRNGGEDYTRMFQESLRVNEILHGSVPLLHPSPELKRKVMSAVAIPPRRVQQDALIDRIAAFLGFNNPRIGFSLAVSLAVIIALGSVLTISLFRELDQQQQQLSAYDVALTEQRQRFTALQTEMQRTEAVLNVLRSPKIEMVMLNGLEVNPAGYGKIIWDPVRKVAILQVSKMPAAPMDRDYQLWYLDKDKKPVSAGLFTVADVNENFFSVTEVPLPDSVQDITAFAVTIEPKGGVPQPTGDMYLLGTPAVN